ncbi:MAG: hypothetical protein H7832_01940 [Magnetococcus sp. DMHC-6]
MTSQTKMYLLTAAAIVLVVGLVVGAYFIGVKKGSVPISDSNTNNPPTARSTQPIPNAAPPPPQSAGGSELRQVGKIPPGAVAPANHPPIPTGPQRDSISTEGVSADKPRAGVKFVHFRVGNRNVKDMLADGRYVWVGTSGGVIRYDTQSDDYKLFDVRNGSLLANGVFHVGRLGQDKISVGTYGGGWSIYDQTADKWSSFNIPDGLADAFVYDVLELKNGDVWVATWSGANRIRGGQMKDRSKWDTFTVENTQGGLPNNWVYGLAEGKNGEVWLATEGGLARFKEDKWQHWNHDDGLGMTYEKVKEQNQFMNDPGLSSSHHARQKEEQGLSKVTTAYNPNYIISLQVDPQGNVWCGTWGGGLARFDGQKWVNFSMSDGLPSNYIFMLHQDQQHRLWLGTSKGLARMDGAQFKVLTTQDGLFSNNVFSMSFAEDGSMWVGSYGGVARIFPETKTETGTSPAAPSTPTEAAPVTTPSAPTEAAAPAESAPTEAAPVTTPSAPTEAAAPAESAPTEAAPVTTPSALTEAAPVTTPSAPTEAAAPMASTPTEAAAPTASTPTEAAAPTASTPTEAAPVDGTPTKEN